MLISPTDGLLSTETPPAGNFEPDFLSFISATLNNLTSERILPQQSM